MKALRKLLVATLTALCAVACVAGIAACDDDEEDFKVDAQYEAVYGVYSQTVGSGAKSLEEWYNDITAGINALSGGQVSSIGAVSVGEGEVPYVKVQFSSGKLYMMPITSGGGVSIRIRVL